MLLVENSAVCSAESQAVLLLAVVMEMRGERAKKND